MPVIVDSIRKTYIFTCPLYKIENRGREINLELVEKSIAFVSFQNINKFFSHQS